MVVERSQQERARTGHQMAAPRKESQTPAKGVQGNSSAERYRTRQRDTGIAATLDSVHRSTATRALLVPVDHEIQANGRSGDRSPAPTPTTHLFAPISKCFVRFKGSCILYLHSLHSRRSVTFLVVLACTRTTKQWTAREGRESRGVATNLLVEDGLCLTTVTLLLPVVTPLSLGKPRRLARLVLRDLVHGVLAALSRVAKGTLLLRDVHHLPRERQTSRWRRNPAD